MGVFHMAGTLISKAMYPTDTGLVAKMQTAQLNLTPRLTMLKAWIGFNATHSSGVIFLGLINFFLAWRYFETIRHDAVFAILTLSAVLFYVVIARIYWFRGVFLLLLVALLIFVVGAILMIADN